VRRLSANVLHMDNEHHRERKSLDALQRARRELDHAAQEAMREAARLLQLSDEIDQRIRRAKEAN